jgi:hypothetical protein
VTELSRPVLALLSATFDAPGSDERADVARLRESLSVALRRCEELVERRDVRAGPWEGGARQVAVETPRWRAGRLRREIVVAIERSMTCLPIRDAAGLRECADRIVERDVAVAYPGLPDALRACAFDVERGALGVAARGALASALATTPFGPAVDRLAAE